MSRSFFPNRTHTAVLGGPDITIKRPNGDEVYIIRGSEFFHDRLALLEDLKVDEAHQSSLDYLRGSIPRDVFLDALKSAATLIGLLISSHGFGEEQVNQIAKYCLDQMIYGDLYSRGDNRESTFLLYGCMKILANKLAYLHDLNSF